MHSESMDLKATAFVAVEPLNFRRTFSLQNLGSYDPTASLSEFRLCKTFFSDNGPCTVEIVAESGGASIHVCGPDSSEVLQLLSAGFGRDDGYALFDPEHALVSRMHRRFPGLRLLSVPWLFDIACSVVLQQRVRFVDAAKSWRLIANKYGAETHGMSVFPSVSFVASMESWQLEELGVDGKRARTLIVMAREFKRRPLRFDTPFAEARAMLQRIPGIGPWSVDYILGYGLADPDALPVGDLFLPHIVTYAFTGAMRGSDDLMVEILEQFRGQRFRVVRLLAEAGISVPRTYSPRVAKRIQ